VFSVSFISFENDIVRLVAPKVASYWI
jgi:hypothetical protein